MKESKGKEQTKPACQNKTEAVNKKSMTSSSKKTQEVKEVSSETSYSYNDGEILLPLGYLILLCGLSFNAFIAQISLGFTAVAYKELFWMLIAVVAITITSITINRRQPKEKRC